MTAHAQFEQFITDTPLANWSVTSTAIQAAWIAHDGQTDKSGADYYDAHIADVVDRLGDELPAVRAVAYLHDVLEDSDITEDQLRRVLPADVVSAVVAITHTPSEPRADYYARVKANPLALRVKLADIASNTDPDRLALLDEETRQRLTTKYAKALEALL